MPGRETRCCPAKPMMLLPLILAWPAGPGFPPSRPGDPCYHSGSTPWVPLLACPAVLETRLGKPGTVRQHGCDHPRRAWLSGLPAGAERAWDRLARHGRMAVALVGVLGFRGERCLLDTLDPLSGLPRRVQLPAGGGYVCRRAIDQSAASLLAALREHPYHPAAVVHLEISAGAGIDLGPGATAGRPSRGGSLA